MIVFTSSICLVINAYRKIFNAPYDAPGVLYSEDTNNYSWLFSFFSNAGVVTSDLS